LAADPWRSPDDTESTLSGISKLSAGGSFDRKFRRKIYPVWISSVKRAESFQLKTQFRSGQY
jgi:hypothetical protein